MDHNQKKIKEIHCVEIQLKNNHQITLVIKNHKLFFNMSESNISKTQNQHIDRALIQPLSSRFDDFLFNLTMKQITNKEKTIIAKNDNIWW